MSANGQIAMGADDYVSIRLNSDVYLTCHANEVRPYIAKIC